MKTQILRRLQTSVLILLSSISLMAQQTFTSTGTGFYDDASTWDLLSVPGPLDKVVVKHFVTVRDLRTIAQVNVDNSDDQPTALNFVTGGDLSVTGNLYVDMRPGFLKDTDVRFDLGGNLAVAGNVYFVRENESTKGSRFHMTGGTALIKGSFRYTYLAGGYKDGALGDLPETVTEIHLEGTSELVIDGALSLIQEDAATLTTFQFILQVRTENDSKLTIGYLLMQQDVATSQHVPQIHLESWDKSNVWVKGNVVMNQIGASSDLLRFESEGNSTFQIDGSVIIDKQAGRTVLFELLDNSVGSIAGDFSFTKSGGNSNIALRARNTSRLTINGTSGITKTDNGGIGSMSIDIEPDANMFVPNGSVTTFTNSSGAGPTSININGNLEIGENLNLNSSYELQTIILTGTLTVGNDLIINSLLDTQKLSGFFITNGTLNVGSDFTVNQNGSTNDKTFFIDFDGNFSGDIGGNFIWNDQRGTASLLFGSVVAGSIGTLTVGGNFTMAHNTSQVNSSLTTLLYGNSQIDVQGEAIISLNNSFATTERNKVYLYDNSNLSVAGNLTVSSRQVKNATLYFFNNSSLILGNTLIRPFNYADIAFNDQSFISFNGISPQVIPGDLAAAGTDKILYNKIVVNNTSSSIPQFTLASDVTLSQLEFIQGIIQTSLAAKIVFRETGESTGASNSGFIDGIVQKLGTSDFEFPTGDYDGTTARWAPIQILNITGGTPALVTSAEYFIGTPPNNTDVDPTLPYISGLEYWDIDPSESISSDVKLFWKDAEFSEITDDTDLAFAHFNGTLWADEFGRVEEGSTVGPGGEGAILATLASFSPVSFGSKGKVNPLPVTLIDFNAELKDKFAEVSWTTSSEVNNSYFEVEKSMNGREFLKIAEVKGHGTTSESNHYSIQDRVLNGINYYRLKQSDFDGNMTYSKVISVEKRDFMVSSPIIYPNPMTSGMSTKLTIDLNPELANSGEVLNVSLIGPTGNLVTKKDVVYDGSSINLDLDRDLNKGIHFVVISNVFKRYQSKLLVE